MVKEKVLDYANKISRVKRGTKAEIKPEYPEYRILEPILTDEMAEVGLCLRLREPQTVEEISALCGKPVELTSKLLWEMADAGAVCVQKLDGVDKYWHEIWVPGHMEMIVNHKENVRKYPDLAVSFDGYGKRRAPMAAGNFPVGSGPMRVIPIERALDGDSRRASYEEISHHLNQARRFSVSDCSCRTSREVMGEGCGHLKEEMCIQLDHAAEYYIRTGRAREISREEAFEIIRRAEDNGLMHQIPNTDGDGKTHAICNCCGCGCFATRIAGMWNNPDMVRSNYVSQIDKDACVACGECVENCPTNALKVGSKLCSKDPIQPKKRELPYDTEWGPDKWNPDYRVNRQVALEEGSSPCKAKCPAHIGIQGYIKLASQGKYREALELIKNENPFPAVCGRVCPRYCESACTRGDVDDPIAIDDIKKFIAEQDLNEARRYVPRIKHDYGKKIAVVGAGPAGLSCAYFLAVDGYKVTVFEKQRTLGGMLSLGIPGFRLGKNVVDAEIDVLKALGVEFKTGVEVGKDLSLAELRSQGFKAFYLAIGAQAGRRLGLEGEDAEGVATGVDFLREVNLGEAAPLEGRVVVIGGGNVAIDVARAALRKGAAEVAMYCLEARDEMPALEEEIEEALEERVAVNNSWGPKRIVVEAGKLKGVEFKKCVSVFDENKRFKPVYDESQTLFVEANRVLLSVGQAIDWGKLLEGTKAELNPDKTVKADPTTYQSAEPDVFVGGDAYTGPRFAIDAIAAGKEAAISIHRFVQPGQSLLYGRTKREYKAFDKGAYELEGYDRQPRQRALREAEPAQSATLAEGRGTLSEEQVKKETERCLGCGATVVDEYMCVGCGACVLKCKFNAIKLVKRYDVMGVEVRKLKPIVVKYMLKRKLRILLAKPFKKIAAAVKG